MVDSTERREEWVSLSGRGVLATLSAMIVISLGVGTMVTSWIMPAFLEKAGDRFERVLDRRMQIHSDHVHRGAATEKYVDDKVVQILSRMEHLATREDLAGVRATVDTIARDLARDSGK